MEAIILAGGKGTRLAGLLKDIPKPLAPIADKPFLVWLLTYLIAQGYDRVTLSVGYQEQKIKSFFGTRFETLTIQYSSEETPLGTGGAIKKALQMLDTQDITVLNGDTFYAIDHQSLYRKHSHGQLMTMALQPVSEALRYGTVVTDDTKTVISFKGAHAGPGLINAGVYILNTHIFEHIELPLSFSFEKDFLQEYLEQLRPQGVIDESFFIDIGIPRDYERAQSAIPDFFASSLQE